VSESALSIYLSAFDLLLFLSDSIYLARWSWQRFRVSGFGFRVSGFGLGCGSRVQGAGFLGGGCRFSGFHYLANFSGFHIPREIYGVYVGFHIPREVYGTGPSKATPRRLTRNTSSSYQHSDVGRRDYLVLEAKSTDVGGTLKRRPQILHPCMGGTLKCRPQTLHPYMGRTSFASKGVEII
jgi:hypothetical protein